MSDRTTYLLLGALTALMVSAQVAIKPRLNGDAVHEAAQRFGSATAYNGMFVEAFELPLRDGTTFRLADHVGREIVVLNFFATWCEPCRVEMPELAAYASRHTAAPAVMLVAVDVEERAEEVDAFVKRIGLTSPVGIDARGAIARQFTVTAYPTTVVVGADGRIKLYQVGAIRNADAALNRIVEAESAALADRQRDWHGEYVVNSSVGASLTRRRDGFKPPDESAVDGLSGRARSIAEAMPCPCGCDDRVIACDCHTSKGIKAALRAGVDPSLTDKQVMEKLNKEFCMKGM